MLKKRLWLTPWRRFLLEKLTVAQPVRKFPTFFMEPERSLPCSQEPPLGPIPRQMSPVNTFTLFRHGPLYSPVSFPPKPLYALLTSKRATWTVRLH
jgi:hypothetical protein